MKVQEKLVFIIVNRKFLFKAYLWEATYTRPFQYFCVI